VIASFWPILVVDVGGSVLMIVFSFLCIGLVYRLRQLDPHNVVWTYLFWVCIGLAGFAISRSAGHILKQALVLSGHKDSWGLIRPISGAINTFMFAFVASVTLFFERVWKIYEQITADKTALQKAHADLLHLNQNLEGIVLERSKALALSERQYRRIFEVSRDMILVVDSRGAITDNRRPPDVQPDVAGETPRGNDSRPFSSERATGNN
jgi:PAS domain-containing protein